MRSRASCCPARRASCTRSHARPSNAVGRSPVEVKADQKSGNADLRIETSGQTASLRIYEKGVRDRGSWEAEVERHHRHVPNGPLQRRAACPLL